MKYFGYEWLIDWLIDWLIECLLDIFFLIIIIWIYMMLVLYIGGGGLSCWSQQNRINLKHTPCELLFLFSNMQCPYLNLLLAALEKTDYVHWLEELHEG